MLLQNISHFCSRLPLDFLLPPSSGRFACDLQTVIINFDCISDKVDKIPGIVCVLWSLYFNTSMYMQCTLLFISYYKNTFPVKSGKVECGSYRPVTKKDFVPLYLAQCCRFLSQNTFTTFSDSPPGKAVSSCCEMGV